MARSEGQRKSKLQENRAAKELGGYVQKASGASDFAKGDVRKAGDLRVECKTTSKKEFSLKFSDLLKIQDEAMKGGAEDWVFQIEFQGQMGQNQKLAVMLWGTYEAVGGIKPTSPVREATSKTLTIKKTDYNWDLILWTCEGRTMFLIICPWYDYLNRKERNG
jgi:hypothetical protein